MPIRLYVAISERRQTPLALAHEGWPNHFEALGTPMYNYFNPIDVLYWLLTHPVLGSVLGFAGLFVSYYFYKLQNTKESKIDDIISRLQEENRELKKECAQLKDELVQLGARKGEADAHSVEPGRESVVIRLRGKWQTEDQYPGFLRNGLPALLIAAVVVLMLGSYWGLSISQKAREALAPLIFFSCLALGFVVAVGLERCFRKYAHRKKNHRLRNSFVEARLSLPEIDAFRRWVMEYPWRYFPRDGLLRYIDSLATTTLKNN